MPSKKQFVKDARKGSRGKSYDSRTRKPSTKIHIVPKTNKRIAYRFNNSKPPKGYRRTTKLMESTGNTIYYFKKE